MLQGYFYIPGFLSLFFGKDRVIELQELENVFVEKNEVCLIF